VIAEALAGKRIAITGSTGFVGTALVERLLRSVPDCELVLLV
jgi:fatty acyl-CoA reductase